MTDELVPLRLVAELTDASLQSGGSAAPQVWPTGFSPLDTYLGGGLRAGELTLLGGAQGLGKTTFALQMLRSVVAAGGSAVYFSYEHDPATLFARLLCVESAASGYGAQFDGLQLRQVREIMENLTGDARTLRERLSGIPGGLPAADGVQGYGDRLFMHRSTAAETGLVRINELVKGLAETAPLVVVDYLQKVAMPGAPLMVEDERVTVVVEGLKDLALEFGVPVLAIVAADHEGTAPGVRLRIHNLRGSTALGYEADVVLLLNEKYDVVARHHLVYDIGNAERFRSYAVVSLEKNRSGVAHVDLEFRKRFDQGRFETDGKLVAERLVDERIFTE